MGGVNSRKASAPRLTIQAPLNLGNRLHPDGLTKRNYDA